MNEHNYVIRTENLTKKYSEQIIINGVDLHVPKGAIYGLLGRNGAGKTTIMKMILGLASVTSGNVNLFGKSMQEYQKSIYSRIGSIIETPGFYPNLTGTENLQVFATLRGIKNKTAVQNALEIVGLPYKDKKPFSKYSLGMKQRLGIANAILGDPDLLILDEPTNGLDPIGIAEIRILLKELCVRDGKTILISSHQLTEIEHIADVIGIIDNGVLIEELDYKKLEKYIHISVSDLNGAQAILENKLGITSCTVEEPQTIKIFDTTYDTKLINRTLVESGIEVSAIYIHHNSLEEHFKAITGGVGIA